MHKTLSLLTAGAAALALGCVPVFAGEKQPATHEMTVRLPDGGVAHIEYAGDTPPKVTFGERPFAFETFWPSPATLRFRHAFETFDRLSREMDRRMASLLDEARMLRAVPMPDAETLMEAAVGDGAPGAYGYSFMSTTTAGGGKSCTRTVEITAPAPHAKPQIVKRSAGDCGPDANDGAPAAGTTL